MPDKMLELCRAVKYTPNPNGRKGSCKCGECGFFFVPDDVVYSFDHPALFWDDVEYHAGREWHKATGCCPNCWPKGPGLELGGRRCLGKRNQNGWQRNLGCGEWFSVLTKRKLNDEKRKRNRVKICWGCTQDGGYGSKIDWEPVREYARIWAAKLGRPPTQREWSDKRRRDMPGLGAVQYRFDKYSSFIRWCGLEARVEGQNAAPNSGQFKRQFSTRKLLKLMRKLGQEYGRALSASEWNALDLGMTADAISLRFADKGRYNGWRKAWLRTPYEPFPDTTKDTPEARACLAAAREKARHNKERRQRKLDERTVQELNKMLAAHRRFEDAKFRSAKTV